MRQKGEKSARLKKVEKTVAGPTVETHTSQWEAPFDLTAFPPELAKECLRCAPFLLGGQNAKYDADFFKRVMNLNDGGSVMSDFTESKCPREKFEDEWPQVEGRYYLADATNKKVRDAALCTYIQVYGGPPDNGGVGTQFLRAIYMETMHGEKINWSEWAAKIANDRLKNAGRNPLKLTPPTLREQIERILKILGDATSVSTNCKPGLEHEQRITRGKQSREAKLDSKDAPLELKTSKIVEQSGSSKAKVEQTKLDLKSRQKGLVDPEGAIIPKSTEVPLRHGKGNRGEETQKAMTTVENSSVNLEADLEDVRRKEVDNEGVLKRLWNNQCRIKVKLAEAKVHHARVDAESSQLGDAFSAMHQRRQTLIKEGDAKGKKEIDAEMRKNTLELVAVTKEFENVDCSITELEGELEENKEAISSVESDLQKFKSRKQQLILETATVKPRQVFWKLPYQLQELHLEEDLPCALCHMFFVDRAAVPFSCGCLFHPHCMWSTVLIGGNSCPRCSAEGTPHWLSQWGFSMSTEMAHHVTKTLMNMDSLGWREPNEFATKHWSLKKRARESDEDVDSLPIKMQKQEESTEDHQKLLEPKTGKEDIEPKMLLKLGVEATNEAGAKHQAAEPSLEIQELDEAKLMEHSLVVGDLTLEVQKLAKGSLDVGDLEVPKAEKIREEFEAVAEELKPKVSPPNEFGEHLLDESESESKIQNQAKLGDASEDAGDLNKKVSNEKKVEEHPLDAGDSDPKIQQSLGGPLPATSSLLDADTTDRRALTKEEEQELNMVLGNLCTSP